MQKRAFLAGVIAPWAMGLPAFAQEEASQSADTLPIVLLGGGILVAAIFLASFGRNPRASSRTRKSGDDGSSTIAPAAAGSGNGKDSHHDGHDGGDGGGDGGGGGGGD